MGLPAYSWYQEPTQAGGILFGNVCHFIDLATWFQQSVPVEVHAFATRYTGHRD
jgi:predicted dehydrogenase